MLPRYTLHPSDSPFQPETTPHEPNGSVAVRATGEAGSGWGSPSAKRGAGLGRSVAVIGIKASLPGLLPGPVRAACGPACCGAGAPAAALLRRIEAAEQGPARDTFLRSGSDLLRLVSVLRSGCGSGPVLRSGPAAVLLRYAVAIRNVNGSRGPGALRSGRGPGRVCSRVCAGGREGGRVCCRARAGSWGCPGGRRRCCGSWTRRFHTVR